MPRDPMLNVLIVLDASPEEPGAPNLFHAWISDLLVELRAFCRVSLFYPVMSATGPFYRLCREETADTVRFFTHVPYKHALF